MFQQRETGNRTIVVYDKLRINDKSYAMEDLKPKETNFSNKVEEYESITYVIDKKKGKVTSERLSER